MNYKLINIKNLLKIIISCLVVLSMCKSCVNAASWQTITTTLTDEQIVDKLVEKFGLNLNGHKSDIMWGIARGFSFDLWTDNAQFVVGTFTNNKDNLNGVTFNGCYWVRNCLTTSAASNYYNREVYFSTGGSNTIYTLRRYNSSWHEYSTIDWSINDPITPPFEFTPYSIDEIDDYNIVKFAYTGDVALGALGDNTFYQLQVRLKDKNLNTIGTAYYDENGNNYYTDNALVIDGDIIKASTVYLYYTQPYILEFTIYSDSNNYEINSYLYKFYPYSAVIENGVIVDSGDTTFNNQDQSIFIVNSIVGELPSGDKPGSGILGGIASLFIPRASFFLEYFNSFNTWLGDHLGILYAPFEIIFNLLNRIINVDFTDPMVEFGPFNLPLNDDIELINHYEYHFNDLLQDDSMAQIHDIYLIIVDGILILGLLYMVYCKYEEIIGGK